METPFDTPTTAPTTAPKPDRFVLAMRGFGWIIAVVTAALIAAGVAALFSGG